MSAHAIPSTVASSLAPSIAAAFTRTEGSVTAPASQAPLGTPQAAAAAAQWVAAFESALIRRDAPAAAMLFVTDGHWRDLVAFTGTITTVSGRAAIANRLGSCLDTCAPEALQCAASRTPPRWVQRAGRDVLEAIIEFRTASGTASGVLRAVADPEGPAGIKAWVLLTALQALHGDDRRALSRDKALDSSREFGGENWLDLRNRARHYTDHDPEVLVIGAGQAGLSIAARLSADGVDTLVIDRETRIGDNWRNRYHSLTLHNEVHVNHLPFMPFPPTWPTFIPKDKLGNWFEAYADSLELNCWTGTELTAGTWDQASRRWLLELKRDDGSVRTMRPKHLVFACGVSAIAKPPQAPGLGDFAGTVMHSGDYTDGRAWRGKRALVLGTGNSAHDVAQDLHAHGAQVSMIQRSPTHVVSLRQAQRVYAMYTEGMPIDDSDLLATAMPYPALIDAYKVFTELSRQVDQPLLDRLAARGFRLTAGEDDTGFQMMYLRRGGGYYFNVGCSDLIADGKVGLIQYDDTDGFVPHGLRMKDGTTRQAELIVTATGYYNPQEVVRRALGDAVAQQVGEVWGVDQDGEVRNMWRPTGQPGLWFTAGSLAQCRIYSRYLSLQIRMTDAAIPGALDANPVASV
jgi:cation diffusion facilitator CzcD-associated flavoprotein CzcO